MAKISTIKFEIKGVHYVANVNCTSSGEFNVNLPTEVAEALNLESKIRCMNLTSLEKEFSEALERYKKAETSEELYILIKYLSSGKFNETKTGDCLHNEGSFDKYTLSISFSSEYASALAFHYMIVIKKTVDENITWHTARKGSTLFRKEEEKNKYYITGKIWHVDKWKAIPYSKEAIQTLDKAQEVIRSASEVLYNFIIQDEKTIELLLTTNKLLNP